MTNVSRIPALGGSECCILRCLEAGGWKSLELEVWSSDLRSSGFGCLEVSVL